MMITKIQLEEWKSLCEAATRGGWNREGSLVINDDEWFANNSCICYCSKQIDAKFIAASRSAMPQLIYWCEQLTESIDQAHSNYDRLLKDYQEQKKRIVELEAENKRLLTDYSGHKDCDNCKHVNTKPGYFPCSACKACDEWEPK